MAGSASAKGSLSAFAVETDVFAWPHEARHQMTLSRSVALLVMLLGGVVGHWLLVITPVGGNLPIRNLTHGTRVTSFLD
jgi:hypothetical protein